MTEGGYIGKILRVDLSKKAINIHKLSKEFMVKYVGGRGWAARIIWDEALEVSNAFAEENKLVIMTGPLTGTPAPGSCKTTLASISPATNIYGDSNVGGMVGIELKEAGFDGIVVEGASKRPVYLWIEDGHIEIRSAEHLWGLGSLTAEEKLKKELGADVGAMTIGPAGENLVKYACVTCDYGNQAARTGMGAVMGSKKLKAIVVRGGREIPIARKEEVNEVYKEAIDYMVKKEEIKTWWEQGLMQIVEWAQEASCLPTRNFQSGVFELADLIGGRAMAKMKERDVSCYLCPMACKKLMRARGRNVIGPEYETAVFLGSNIGVSSLEDVAYANWLCDELGLDTISAGAVIAFAMECYERGILLSRDVDGLELRFGNSEAVFKLLEKIAWKEGFGNLLAKGVATAAKRIGRGAERFAMHIKSLELTGYDVRAAPAMALAYATADIGAHHNRAWAMVYDLKVGRNKYGEDKVNWVIYLQHVRPLFDSLGVCRLPWVELGLDLKVYVKLYRAVTGVEASLEDLLKRSEGVYNITRAIGVARGLTKSMDCLPERFFNDPLPEGPLKGAVLNREHFDKMLSMYYEARGWDPRTGVPTRRKLEELGLKDISDRFYGSTGESLRT